MQAQSPSTRTTRGIVAVPMAALVLALAGCPGGNTTAPVKGPAGKGGTVKGSHRSGTGNVGRNGKRSGDSGKSGGAVSGRSAGKGLPGTGISCATRRCMYHPGADGYFRCLNGGAGTCFHYGRSCAPSNRCMYDRKARSYRSCSRVSEGRCLAFAAACEPPGRCMFNSSDNMHHVCDKLDKGRCVRFGAICDPSD